MDSRNYDEEGREAFGQSNMEKAAWCYWKAAQNDTILRQQLQHLSNYYFCLHYLPEVTAKEIYNQISFYDKLYTGICEYVDYKIPKGKIRVGYISGDFRQHAMSSVIRPFLSGFNREKFEIFVYSLNESDGVTREFQSYDVRWRDAAAISPAELAELIYSDGIAILVDLSGHTHGGLSLMTLAFKPAPVQVSGLGWLSTTGLHTVDYFLCDEYAADGFSDLFTEKLLTINECILCYNNHFTLPDINRKDRKNVVFASFSNFDKLTDKILTLWLEILHKIPNSQLILKDTTNIISRQEALRNRLIKIGYNMNRDVRLEMASDDYMSQYNDVDIALDTYPYTGGITVLNALLMGIPVVSLAGDSPSRRMGCSILHYAGFSEWIADSEAEYLEKAVDLGQNSFSIEHENIRKKFLSSAVMDSERYMRSYEKLLERIYESIWKRNTQFRI